MNAWRRFELLYLHSIPIISSKLTFEIPTEYEDDEGIERVGIAILPMDRSKSQYREVKMSYI